MPTIRVMFVGQGASLLPEDRFINVFHFHDPTVGDTAAAMLAACNILESFYTAPTAGGNSLSQFMSPYVSRAAKFVCYDLLAPMPRVPFEVPVTLDAATGAGMPEEVAVCLSITGVPPITPRRRGRIYFGPITDAATSVDMATTTSPSRPSQDSAVHLLQTLTAAGKRLMDDGHVIGLPWCIRSTVPSENFVQVADGYVDNAWDTQRRRGPEPTGRLHFGV